MQLVNNYDKDVFNGDVGVVHWTGLPPQVPFVQTSGVVHAFVSLHGVPLGRTEQNGTQVTENSAASEQDALLTVIPMSTTPA